MAALAQRARRCLGAALDRAGDDVAHTRARLLALSPASTLGRGYAIVQHADDSVVRSAAEVADAEPLTVRFAADQLSVTAARRPSANAGPSPAQSAGPSPAQDPGPSPAQNAGPSPGQSAGTSPAQSAGPSPGQSAGPAEKPAAKKPGPAKNRPGQAPRR